MNSEEWNKFWSRVEKGPTCWNWRGHCSRGYGRCYFRHKLMMAHRLAYMVCVGEIPSGLTLDHLCRNRGCVNPKHLEAVTNRENVLRGEGYAAHNARLTHCIKGGHPLSGTNLLTNGKRRRCRICNYESKRIWRLKKSSEARFQILVHF